MRLAERWDRYWLGEGSLVRLAIFRVAILALALHDLLAYSVTALRDAAAVSAGTAHKSWTPIYLFEVLGLEPIGLETARALQAAAIACIVLGMLGCFSRLACLGAAALSTYWTGLVYSFGKIHHDKVALTFALWALPLAPVGARWSIDALVRRRLGRGGAPPERARLARVPLRLTQVTIAAGYFFAGWTKLVVSGPEWANGYSLMGTIARFDNVLSEPLARSLVACRAMSVATLALQCLFPLALCVPRSRWVLLPGAVLFHLGTWWTMDTGPYVTLWFCLIAFVPLERAPGWLLAQLRSGSIRRAVGGALAVATPAALALWVLWRTLPLWTLPLALAALAAGFRALARGGSYRMSSR